MSKIETAISVQNSLYKQITAVAKELQISESELFEIAAQEYLDRRRQQRLLESLNDAYADGLDSDDASMLEMMRRHQKALTEQAE